MKQDPHQLINDVHEQLADSESDFKILANYSTDPELWGYSKVWLFIVFLPAMFMARFSYFALTGMEKFYGYGAAICLAVLALVVTKATPSSMDARGYFAAIVSHYTSQNDMIHKSDPDDSRLAQPPNTSLIGKLGRLPLVRRLPVIGAGNYNPTQELVAHKKAYHTNEYAIQRDDGAFIAAIRLLPIPLRLESLTVRKKVERKVAKAIDSSVEYDAQWYSPQRVADYSTRKAAWAKRAREYDAQATRAASGPPDPDAEGAASAVEAIRNQVLADVSAEAAAGINLYERTKHVREFFLLVSVDPGEVVVERSSEEGGLGSIAGVGELIERKRLREQAGTPEHVDAMLRKLSRRTNDLATELGRVDGLTTIPLSAMEFSEQVADYYRPTNVHAYDDFRDCLRGAPVPTDDEESGDPEHDVTFRHLTNRPEGIETTPLSPTAPTMTPSTQNTTDADPDTEPVSAEAVTARVDEVRATDGGESPDDDAAASDGGESE
jgi:hypothetical protein